jgi:hypothetical protein
VTGRVEEADELLRTPDERRGHDAITRQLGDARAAITWALSNDPSIAVRLGGALMLFGQSRARDEVLGWAEEVVAAVDPLPAGDSSARCLAAAAQRAVNVGRLDDARRLAGAATAHGSSGAVRALAYELLSDIELFTGDLERARRLAGHSLDAARTDDDPHALVIGVVNLALAHAYDTDATPPVGPDDVPRHLRLAPSDRAWLHYLAGEVQMDRDPVVALAALDAAIDLADSVGNGYISSVARVSAASLRSRIGDPVVAVEPFVELVQQLLGRGNRTHLLTALRNMVVLLQRLDLPEDTAELLGAVDDDEATASFGEERERLLGARAWVTDRLGSPETAHRVSRGRQRDLDAAARVAIGAVSRA